ncbi:MAG: SOS response-associated peptidase [Desulfomonilia bacterium]|jgi:putative SOS response-associated peptidase YedK
MCGRFIQIIDPELIEVDFSELEVDEEALSRFIPSYNVTPTKDILTVLNTPTPRLTLTHWGLIPYWSKDKNIGSRMINARSETLIDKPSFKEPLKRNRCIIPAIGFYEWDTANKTRTPYLIRLKSGKPLAFAGLWDRWRDKETGNTIISSTIITTEANSLIAQIHGRMPAILSPGCFKSWLSSQREEEVALLNCLKPYPAEEMEAYEVSKLVNDPRNDSPEIIDHVLR